MKGLPGSSERTGHAIGTDDRPTIGTLFISFLGTGMMGFGGVLPMARHMIVDERKWMSPAEFAEMLGLCQFLPGGNIINLSVAVGMRFRGVPGAAASLLGLVTAPGIIVILLGMVYTRFQDQPQVRHVFAGLAATAAGLLIGVVVKMTAALRGQPVSIALAVICFAAIAVLRLPLLPTMLVLAPLSIACARLVRSRPLSR